MESKKGGIEKIHNWTVPLQVGPVLEVIDDLSSEDTNKAIEHFAEKQKEAALSGDVKTCQVLSGAIGQLSEHIGKPAMSKPAEYAALKAEARSKGINILDIKGKGASEKIRERIDNPPKKELG